MTVVARLRAAGCVFAEDEARLLAEAGGDLDALVERRVSGVPLEHVLGWAELAGVRVAVDEGVFVPRRRTELLVRTALAVTPSESPTVVDLCCGSGAVGAAFAHARPRAAVHAADHDERAVRCAARNVAHAHLGDLYDALPASLRHAVDVIAVNAPYVPTEAIALMPPEARLHEPRAALDGGTDGLHVQRRVVAGARDWLAPGGHLLVETSEAQAAGTAEAFSRNGFRPTMVRDEELDATVVYAPAPVAGSGGGERHEPEERCAAGHDS